MLCHFQVSFYAMIFYALNFEALNTCVFGDAKTNTNILIDFNLVKIGQKSACPVCNISVLDPGSQVLGPQ